MAFFAIKVLLYVGLSYMYCHVPGVLWRIITGSGLDDWIYWHFYYNYTQLQSTMTAHNRWMPKTCSVPSWTTSIFLSSAADLVLIYESVTSSASVVCWLTLHSWTPNCPCEWTHWWFQYKCSCMMAVSRMPPLWMNYMSFYNPVWTKDRTLPWTVHLLYSERLLPRKCVLTLQ
jgi:hypothetical protein